MCVTFTGVCILTQVVAPSAVTPVRAVDVNTLVTAWTAQTLIYICSMTHTRSGSVNRTPNSDPGYGIINPSASVLEKCYRKNSLTNPITLIPSNANIMMLSALC